LHKKIFGSTKQEENTDVMSDDTNTIIDKIEDAPVNAKSPEKIKKVTIPAILFLILGIIAAWLFDKVKY